jgi:hypothetical protein
VKIQLQWVVTPGKQTNKQLPVLVPKTNIVTNNHEKDISAISETRGIS